MIKYFHEVTKGEWDEILKRDMTWEECAKEYPQPRWCTYPDAVCGVMGCASLMACFVTGMDYCKDCDCFREK